MLYNYKNLKIFLVIFLWMFHTSQSRHTIKPRALPSLLSSSYYESLKESLKPVLERSNVRSQARPQSEPDNNNGHKDKLGVEEPSSHTSEYHHNRASNRYGQYRPNQDYEISDLTPYSSVNNNSNKYYILDSESFKHQLNKSSMAPSEHEVDYDYSNQDNPDVEEPPAPIFEHKHGNNTITKNTVKSLVEKLRHGVQSKNTESLYEKYKSNLSPLIQNLNLSFVKPKHHDDAFRFITENQKNVSHAPPAKFSSLYDQFKKRLVDFSSELDIDSGLTNGRVRTDIQSNLSNDVKVHDNEKLIGYNGGIHSDHVTAEFRKVQNIVNRMEKEVPSTSEHKKRYEQINMEKQNNMLLSKTPTSAEWDYHKNNHRKDNGQQITAGGSYTYNDYNYEDNFRPLPIFRKPEVPLRQKNRPLRGIENANKDYLTWSHTPGTDGSVYNKIFPTVYTDSINSQLANLTAQSLLEHIAQRLNTSTLEVAKKVAGIQGLNLSTLKTDPQLHKILQEYIENTVISAAQSVGIVGTSTISPNFQKEIINIADTPNLNFKNTLQSSDLPKQRPYEGVSSNLQQYIEALDKDLLEMTTPHPPMDIENKSGMSSKEVSQILGKLMNRLDEIESKKNYNIGCSILEDSPCKLNGSWLSKTMGLRFDITLKDNTNRKFLSNEARSYGLNVTILECTPPRPHDIMGTDWPITGSALKGNGGPFFLYAQKLSENIIATFVGYCRNCGGLDTIYGTWTFSFPSKSCQDTPVSFQTKNDIMRRYKLEEKRDQRNRTLFQNKIKQWKKPL